MPDAEVRASGGGDAQLETPMLRTSFSFLAHSNARQLSSRSWGPPMAECIR